MMGLTTSVLIARFMLGAPLRRDTRTNRKAFPMYASRAARVARLGAPSALAG